MSTLTVNQISESFAHIADVAKFDPAKLHTVGARMMRAQIEHNESQRVRLVAALSSAGNITKSTVQSVGNDVATYLTFEKIHFALANPDADKFPVECKKSSQIASNICRDYLKNQVGYKWKFSSLTMNQIRQWLATAKDTGSAKGRPSVTCEVVTVEAKTPKGASTQQADKGAHSAGAPVSQQPATPEQGASALEIAREQVRLDVKAALATATVKQLIVALLDKTDLKNVQEALIREATSRAENVAKQAAKKAAGKAAAEIAKVVNG